MLLFLNTAILVSFKLKWNIQNYLKFYIVRTIAVLNIDNILEELLLLVHQDEQ